MYRGRLAAALTTDIALPAGSLVHLRTGSRGGYDEPADRDPAAVEADLRAGYITAAYAREHHRYTG